MNADQVPASVMDDLEEIFDAEGMLPLYQVAWTISGSVSRSDRLFEDRRRQAYDAFVVMHADLRLVWVPWPIDLGAARPADPGTPIDLDLDPEAPADTQLLALVDPALLPH